MDSGRREQIREHYKNFSTTVVLLDDRLDCVYCNKPSVMPEGHSLKPYMQKDIEIPIIGTVNVMIILNGVSYCGRFEQFEEGLIKCEMFDSNTLQTMAERTDFFGKWEKFLLLAMQGVSRLRSLTSTFKDAIDNDVRVYPEIWREYSLLLSCLDPAVNNAFQYNTMLCKAPDFQQVNAVTMVKGIVERCNTILSKCGRCIDLVCDIDNIYIRADKRYAFNALVNLIHNALVYSRRDHVPVVSLTKVEKDGREYVFLKTLNKTALYNENFGDDFNSGFYRLGFGLKIIKRFAEHAGGEYIENISENLANIGVLIPAIIPAINVPDDGELTLENGSDERYETGIPDLLDIKMREIVDFFGVIT